MHNTLNPLLGSEPLHVANIGVELIAENLERQKVDVVHIHWAPPAKHDAELSALLDSLL
ncbi:hypothetical protein [Gluconobacter wancherniae]|uniref:hypothetical protein n=1 Tax=Gluconobacter wancherniae TaxID=1307955 RepID=UPI001B8ACCEC|nr:hypothetical protein [Gluconobacter wancherniae]MBS1089711.1 hypothetical protein [Gluconobacter wancherniae]